MLGSVLELRDNFGPEGVGDFDVVEVPGNFVLVFLDLVALAVNGCHDSINLREDINIEDNHEGDETNNIGNFCGVQWSHVSISD